MSPMSLTAGQVRPIFRVDSRTARPMVLLARQPWPKNPIPPSIPISPAMGPVTIISRLNEPADASTCRSSNVASVIASITPMITGRYSGLAPAMTALTAIFSMVATPCLGLRLPIISPGARFVPESIHLTRSGVGGTSGRPSPHLLSR